MINHSVQQVGTTKMSVAMPIIKLVAQQWGLNPNRPLHFKIIRRIINNSIKNN